MDTKYKFVTGISNKEPYPWFDWLVSGEKIWEGRVYRKDLYEEGRPTKWMLLIKDDIIGFYNNELGPESEVFGFKVKERKIYGSFGDAYDELGQGLIPKLHWSIMYKLSTAQDVYQYNVFNNKIDLDEHYALVIRLEKL